MYMYEMKHMEPFKNVQLPFHVIIVIRIMKSIPNRSPMQIPIFLNFSNFPYIIRLKKNQVTSIKLNITGYK